jgi:hypothetical protein
MVALRIAVKSALTALTIHLISTAQVAQPVLFDA